MIISGKYCGYLDPQEELWKGQSGKKFSLAKLQMRPDILAPFYGICGFKENLSEFSGQTLFRFPLRNKSSDLSEKCYSNLEHIKMLITTLRDEAKYLLLFLRSVKSIIVTELRECDCSERLLLSVSISERDSANQKGTQFIEKVSSICASKSSCNTPEVVSCSGQFDVVVKDETSEYQHNWLIVQQVGSTDLHVLEQADKQHVLPWVGTAAEVQKECDNSVDSGRLFCFIPMPCEVTAPIPIHVNGMFALSDNRRSLKWPAKEMTDDEQAEWNKLLVEHCLPSCYVKLIIALIELENEAVVYKAWPDPNRVRGVVGEWSGILEPFFKELFEEHAVVFSSNNKWIRVEDAIFMPRDEDVPVVEKVLLKCGENVSRLSDVLCNAFNCIKKNIRTIDPKFVKQSLSNKAQAYYGFESNEKLELLSYCLRDNDYSTLIGLELLPLVNGTFIRFINSPCVITSCCYLCSDQFPRKLLPDSSQVLVNPDDVSLHCELQKVAKAGITQLRMLCTDSVAYLLKSEMPPHGYSHDWLEIFWSWVRNKQLGIFEDLPVIPVGENQVAKLSKSAGVVYLPSNDNISPELASALLRYQLKVASVKTDAYITHSELDNYLHQFNGAGLLDAIKVTHHNDLANVTPSLAEATALQAFLEVDCNWDCQREQTFSQLSIFYKLTQCQPSLCSISASAKTFPFGRAVVEEDSYGFKFEYIPKAHLVLSCAKNSKRLLRSASSVRFMNKMEFLCEVVLTKVKEQWYSKHVIEDLMTEVLKDFDLLVYKYNNKSTTFIETLQYLPFLTNSDGISKRPTDMFDPSDPLLCCLFKGESVFPIAPYDSEDYLSSLRKCGLRQLNSITSQEILDIVNNIKTSFSKQPVIVDNTKFERAKAVVKFINDHHTQLLQEVRTAEGNKISLQSALEQCAQNFSWLPVCSVCPSAYPSCLKWNGAKYPQCLASIGTNIMALHVDIGSCDLPVALGSSTVFVDGCLPETFATSLCCSSETQASLVISHLHEVVKQKDEFDSINLEKTVRVIYDILNQFSYNDLSSLSNLSNWIWVGKNTFACSNAVALSFNPDFSHSLEPFIYILPTTLFPYVNLFKTLGVNDKVGSQQILSVLEKLQETPLAISHSAAWSLVWNILTYMYDESSSQNKTMLIESDILIPSESDSEYPQLRRAEELVYTDSEFLKSIAMASGDIFTLVHPRVTNSMAQSLGVKPLSVHLDISEDIMADAGQCEPLIQRLKNILCEYKDGLTIVKELLQNADDAGATELNILYDARHHSTSNLFFQDMDKAHGPALVVHNNAMFTDEDFANITKLAGRTKADKPLKIGKFGVGFCSVYHITDVPSFVSRDYLYIFDPSLKHLGKAVKDQSQPGKRIKFTSHHLARSQQLSPYINLFDFHPSQQYSGTMFRFPFREFSSEISGVLYNEHTVDDLKKGLVKEGSKLLLFLKNIHRITFSTIRDGEHDISHQLAVHREDIPTRDVFWKKITVQLPGSSVPTCTHERWLVSEHSQEISCSSSQTTESSVAAVACQVDDKTPVCSDLSGEAFCFLPLSVSTGLPVHVSANFAVMNNRRGIWTSDSSGEKEVEWNLQLMKVTVPQAYVKLLRALKYLSNEAEVQKYEFFSLWPLEPALKSKNPWDIMVTHVYDLLCAESLLYSSSTAEWLALQYSQFLDPDFLSVSDHDHSSPHPAECVIKCVEYLKLPVVYFPTQYINQLVHLKEEQMSIVEQDKFVSMFFDNMNIFDHDIKIQVRNSALLLMLQVCSREIDMSHDKPATYLMKTLEKKECIPCMPNGQNLAQAKHLVSPNTNFQILFDPQDGRYPVDDFCKDPAACRAMEYLGLITKNLPWTLLIDCARSIKDLYKDNQQKSLDRVKQICDCIQENNQVGMCIPVDEANELVNIKFLPVMAKPTLYPSQLSWKGDNLSLLCGAELAYFEVTTLSDNIHYSGLDMRSLVGTQLAIVNTLQPPNGCGLIDRSVQSILGMQLVPSMETVIDHFCCVIEALMNDVESNFEWIRHTCQVVYEFLDNTITKAVVNGELLGEKIFHDKPFIFTGTNFVSPSLVAENWQTKGPYLFPMPDILAMRKNLIKALSVKETFESGDLFSALIKMHRDHRSTKLPENCYKVVDEILQTLNKCTTCKAEKKELPSVYLPDNSYQLHDANNLSYNDAPWCQLNLEQACIFTHHLLQREAALAIGVKPVRHRFLEFYAGNNQNFGLPFGQREDLTVRIKNILRDYPLDATFLKELIQNADDAKANKMCVILDKRSHRTGAVLQESWAELQGPAVLVWNNAKFSDSDLQGIQQLGLGSKRDDLECIGQFGIGFNVVYHITDCPSFITGTTFCILDPHCLYAPGASLLNPGRRFDDIDENFWENFSDLREPYLRDPLPGLPPDLKDGSLFRFPLRNTRALVEQSELVEMKTKELCEEMNVAEWMENHLDDWVPKVKDSMLFLNHLTQFQYFVINEDSTIQLVENFQVLIEESFQKDRKDFHQRAKEFNQSKMPELINYSLSITTEHGDTEKWLVQQGVGDVNNCAQNWIFANQTIPKHGIAALLSTNGHTLKTTFDGKAFCFLPLPNSTTHLPVHVNGQFVLNSNRRSLWSSDESDEKSSWNNNLLQAISSSYAHFLCFARESFVMLPEQDPEQLKSALENYYRIFPYYKPLTNNFSVSSSENTPVNEWKVLAQAVFKRLLEDNFPLLASIGQTHDSKIPVVTWSVLLNTDEPFCQVHFIPNPCLGTMTAKSLQELLVTIGLKTTCAPHHLKIHFGVSLPEATPEHVFNFYLKFHRKILQERNTPCHVSRTNFKTADNFATFTKYISTPEPENMLLPRCYPQSPTDYPLLLTADEQLRVFEASNKVLPSKYSFLFPNSRSKFLHPKVLELCLSMKYYANKEEVSFAEIVSIFRGEVSSSLLAPRADNFESSCIQMGTLQNIWECICNDHIFKHHQETILKTFAFLPATDHQLFSTNSVVLPLLPFDSSRHVISSSLPAYELLVSLGMPVLDERFATVPIESCTTVNSQSEVTVDVLPGVKTAMENCCVNVSKPSDVLRSLYHFHIQNGVLNRLPDTARNVQTLFEYFYNIHFRTNSGCLHYIKSLPLFQTVNGRYISIQNKTVYTWPTGCCKAGYEKWGKPVSIVFLEKDGAWKILFYISDLGGKDLHPVDVYNELIFNAFSSLDLSERNEHLMYIRDNIFPDAERDAERHVNGAAVLFVKKLKRLSCLLDSQKDILQPVCCFYDPRLAIFNTFHDKFLFPGVEFQEDTWLDFFVKLGLRVDLDKEMFVKLCMTVANGSHPKLYEASNELLKYLFSPKALKWHDEPLLLKVIGDICFVRPESLPSLSWIKVPCSPVNHDLQLTTLKGAAVESCSTLVWTVMPVVSVPRLTIYDLTPPDQAVVDYNTVDERNEKFQKKLGMVTKPSVDDVLKNLKCISNSGLANFQLFYKYNPIYIHPVDSQKDDIVQVISANLKFIRENESFKLSELEMVACIPVDAAGSHDVITRPVLVNSLQAVYSMEESERCLQPYISMCMSGLAQEIGVTNVVKIKQLQYLLKVIHNETQPKQLKPNHLLTVRTAVCRLLQLCATSKHADKGVLKELYLPCHQGTLVQSTKIVVMDSNRYKRAKFDFSQTDFKMFHLPPDSSSRYPLPFTGTMMRSLVNLPELVRPKSMVLSCKESMAEAVVEINQLTSLSKQIKRMVSLRDRVGEVVSLLLQHESVSNKSTCDLFAETVCQILSKLQIKVINNLQANIHLTSVNPPTFLGVVDVPFILTRQPGYILYLNSSCKREGNVFWNDLSVHMCIHVAEMVEKSPTTFFNFAKCLANCLRIKDEDDLCELAEELPSRGLRHIEGQNNGSSTFTTPKLGQAVNPEQLVTPDVNNIFREQEWVAYPTENGSIVYAMVLKCTSNDENSNDRKYLIQVGEDPGNHKEVSASEIHKIE